MAQYRRFRGWCVGVVVCVGATLVGVSGGAAQQLIGYVKADDANVTGATDVMDGQAVLAGSVGVTAKDHTAVITLGRGGLARVCQTSALHMTQSKEPAAASKAAGAAGGTATSDGTDSGAASPLLFSLERGAVEIRMNGLANDSIMTPDLRMTVQTNGPLDVRLRVARNGDTCVENHGPTAPVLAVSDPFGTSMYELMAGQHVLFEHGDLHEVVDHETEPCGCPDDKGATVADALLAPGGQKLGAQTAAELHPFPAAVSEGLAPAATPQTEANAAQPDVTTAFSYSGNATTNGTASPSGGGAAAGPVRRTAQPTTVAAMPAPSSAAAGGLGSAPAARQEPAKAKGSEDEPPNRDLAHIVGHFFRFLFGH